MARSFCKAYGGDLVSIGSDEEANFLKTNVFPTAETTTSWIGLIRNANATGELPTVDYGWTDGTKVVYSQFSCILS